MDEDIVEKAETYAARRDRRLVAQLGFGIHGIVFAIEGNVHPGVAALKIHYAEEPYLRVAHSSRVLVPASRRHGLLDALKQETAPAQCPTQCEVRFGEDAKTSARDERATRNALRRAFPGV